MKARLFFSLAAIASLALSFLGLAGVGAQQNPGFAHPAFEVVWNRTDSLVAEGQVSRSWYWGPQPNTPGLLETLTDAPDGSGHRLVQYFDKSRMEINNPNISPNNDFFVTNGLLTVELIGGCVQTSSQSPCGEPRYPAEIPMSGDAGDQLAPTYAAFRNVANSRFGDHPMPDRRGQFVTATIDRNGNVGEDAAKAQVPLTKVVHFEDLTKHNIPEAFWNFLNLTGPVRENGQTVNKPLSSPWFYVTGLPISDAYWAHATIRGQDTQVMIQAFERRVLTYTPTNSAAFQVEMGNIGQHYYDWRYRFAGQPGVGTGTPYYTPSGGGTPTFAPTNPPGTVTPSLTGTVVLTSTVVPTSPVVPTGTVGLGTPGPVDTATPAGTQSPCLACGTPPASPSATATP